MVAGDHMTPCDSMSDEKGCDRQHSDWCSIHAIAHEAQYGGHSKHASLPLVFGCIGAGLLPA